MALTVTGMKPTGTPHLGNLLGMVLPTVALASDHEVLCFVADLHALTTTPSPADLEQRSLEVAATFLACGLDPHTSTLYRQSDVPEVTELAWILSCVTGKGLLNRAHAYKAAVADNLGEGRDPDAGVNAGLFTYPVLMAADILLPGGAAVPVGSDQTQHLEVTRDLAGAFNARYGDVLTAPEAVVDEEVATVPGTDGRKMSKSHGNTICPLLDAGEVARAVGRIVTDTRGVDEPKDPDDDTIFGLYRHVAPADAVARMRRGFAEGGLGYAEAKRRLTDALSDRFGPARVRYRDLLDDPAELDRVLEAGAARVRTRGRTTIRRVREAVGLPAPRAGS
jgi:tryptophanyl-tRNA synthetase